MPAKCSLAGRPGSPNRQHLSISNGFTLIELIIGIVVFSVVMLVVINLVSTQSRRSIDPLWQVRAAELATSLSNEIIAKSFDEQSDRTGGLVRCNEGTACTSAGSLGPDGENRDNYNDVDDYDGLDDSSENILNTLGNQMLINGQPLYAGFRARVSVFYDDDLDGTDDSGGNSAYVGNVKLVSVIVTTPGGEDIAFTSYRWNL